MMKSISVTVALLVASQIAWADQPTFKGIPLGTKQAEFMKAFKSFKCEPPEFEQDPMLICISLKETYGELPVDKIKAEFWRGKLKFIGVNKANHSLEDSTSYYSQWKRQLSLKFGTPSKRDYEFSYESTTFFQTEWDRKSGSIVLTRQFPAAGSSISEFITFVGISSSDYPLIMQERAKIKIGAKVKDM